MNYGTLLLSIASGVSRSAVAPRIASHTKVISVKEHTSLLVLLPSFLRCNDGYKRAYAHHYALNPNKGFR
uniref:Uncharacterized protein n=1 Tax=Candidatus Kentrum sp. FM TaxID=2126340 RepID=A0A450SKP0_9GAMM|nr:MAG: hypothetical protein BECKFM1743C_GA0114222_101349 [Candidatus Kentron sp. FM]VFK10160.1 MAG: hypothetical protein BECKFM1743B_GA0114221_101318 [Candidatus Kentron sp. FM]